MRVLGVQCILYFSNDCQALREPAVKAREKEALRSRRRVPPCSFRTTFGSCTDHWERMGALAHRAATLRAVFASMHGCARAIRCRDYGHARGESCFVVFLLTDGLIISQQWIQKGIYKLLGI